MKILGAVILIVLISLILNYPLMLALNYVFAQSLLIAVFGVAKLTFWRTLVFSMVATFLLSSRGK